MPGNDPSDRSSVEPSVLSILETKLYIPRPQRQIVERSALTDRIDGSIKANHRLILISAPAGFGKSTLLSQWAAQTHSHVAWYSLDEGDNDRTRFLTYLIASLQKLQPEIGLTALIMQQSPQPHPLEEVLTNLINDMLNWDNDLSIVFDDYHLITDADVHRAMEFMLDHIPPKIHFIVSSRSEPPFSLARLRVRNTFTEVNEKDLRFQGDEASAYLNKVMELNLSPEEIEILEKRTEGWIAGLQMAALSIQSQQDKSRIIHSLSGTHRFILDYLIEEVLEHQSPLIQTFMLRTSILDHLSGELCEHVLGDDFIESAETQVDEALKINLNEPGYGQLILESLDKQNLFILPLDDERRWYRYHRLFSELLQNQLASKHPDLIPVLHLRASDWCERNGLLNEAVRHTLSSGDHDRAAKLVGQHALTLVYFGNLSTLARWLDALPGNVKESHPWLCIAHAWALTFAGQLDQVASLIHCAEESLDTIHDPVEKNRIAGIVDALRAYLLAIRGSMSLAAEFAREALKLLPSDDLKLRGFSAMLLATVLRWNGELSEAIDAYHDAIAINQSAGDYNVLVESLCDLAELQALHGELQRSIQTCKKALEVGSKQLKQTGVRLQSHGYAHIRLSDALLECNDLEQARKYALEGLALVEDWGQADLLVRVYLELGRVLLASNEIEGAQAALRDAMQLAVDLSPWYVTRVQALQATIDLRQGDHREAIAWAEETFHELPAELEFQHFEIYIAIVRAELAALRHLGKRQEPAQRALSLLKDLLELTDERGAKRYLIEALVLDSLLNHERDQTARSKESLLQALRIGEAHGFIRVFLDEGSQLEQLLVDLQASTEDLQSDYLDNLLKSFRAAAQPGESAQVYSQQGLVEPLSERELEVLGYLDTHLTSTEIAEALNIAVSTVRTHIKSIYSKLDAHNRNEAVGRAQELDLL
jgi:LuxR family maltose regulon positive regulatory protein